MNSLFQVDIIISKDGVWEENKLLVDKKVDNGSFSVIVALSQFKFLGTMVINSQGYMNYQVLIIIKDDTTK